MRIIGLVARKGGVGKTTLAIHLAQMAAVQGETAVLVDMDIQASSSAWRRKRKAQGLSGVPVVQAEPKDLEGLLEELRKRGATMVFIDTRPDVGPVAQTVCQVADHIIIPTGATVLDLEAIKDTALLAHKAGKPWSVVFNRVRKRSVALRQAREVLAKLTGCISPEALALRDVYSDAIGSGHVAWEGQHKANTQAQREMKQVWSWFTQQDGVAA